MSAPKYLVATEPLFLGQARAHNAGDLVLEESVKANGWEEQCASPTSKEGKKILGGTEDDKPAAPATT